MSALAAARTPLVALFENAHWAFAGYAPWREAVLAAFWQPPAAWAATLSTTVHISQQNRVHGAPAVRFAEQHAPLPAGLDASDVDGSYAARCVDGVVPSRADNLHDLMNALVWARFPLAKRALSARHVRLARARPSSSSSSSSLPSSLSSSSQRLRTREQDSAAMLDEGGLLLGPTQHAVFGHAALEDAVCGRPLRPFLLRLPSDDFDVALAAVLDDDAPLPRLRERATVLAALSSAQASAQASTTSSSGGSRIAL